MCRHNLPPHKRPCRLSAIHSGQHASASTLNSASQACSPARKRPFHISYLIFHTLLGIAIGYLLSLWQQAAQHDNRDQASAQSAIVQHVAQER